METKKTPIYITRAQLAYRQRQKEQNIEAYREKQRQYAIKTLDKKKTLPNFQEIDQEAKNKHNEYAKQYYARNKEILSKEITNCPCGGKFTYYSKYTHEKTKKHTNHVTSQLS